MGGRGFGRSGHHSEAGEYRYSDSRTEQSDQADRWSCRATDPAEFCGAELPERSQRRGNERRRFNAKGHAVARYLEQLFPSAGIERGEGGVGIGGISSRGAQSAHLLWAASL